MKRALNLGLVLLSLNYAKAAVDSAALKTCLPQLVGRAVVSHRTDTQQIMEAFEREHPILQNIFRKAFNTNQPSDVDFSPAIYVDSYSNLQDSWVHDLFRDLKGPALPNRSDMLGYIQKLRVFADTLRGNDEAYSKVTDVLRTVEALNVVLVMENFLFSYDRYVDTFQSLQTSRFPEIKNIADDFRQTFLTDPGIEAAALGPIPTPE